MKRVKSFLVFLFLAFTIAGCTQHDGDGSGGRVAAVVNGVEITQREVDFLAQHALPSGSSESVTIDQRRNILAGLVRAELLAQQGAKMKLDQSPDFIIALHNDRRAVLAGLAEAEIAATAKPVDPQTIPTIVTDNPGYFAERKLLVYEEVLIKGVNLPLLQSLNTEAVKGASLSALVNAVNAKAIPFRRTTRTLTSDKVPPAILKVLSNSTPNVPVIIRVQNKFSMMLMLHNVLPVPLVGTAAEQVAANMLNAQQRNIAFEQKMRAVVDGAKISYFGEFKPGAKRQAVALPMGDPERVAAIFAQQIRRSTLLTLSFTLGMLLLAALMRIRQGSLWLPRLWPQSKQNRQAATLGKFDYSSYAVTPSVYLRLLFIALLALSTLGFQMVLLRSSVPILLMFAAITVGIFIGTGACRLFTLQSIRSWTQRYIWMPVIVLSGFWMWKGHVIVRSISKRSV